MKLNRNQLKARLGQGLQFADHSSSYRNLCHLLSVLLPLDAKPTLQRLSSKPLFEGQRIVDKEKWCSQEWSPKSPSAGPSTGWGQWEGGQAPPLPPCFPCE